MISDFSKSKVLIVGDIMLDKYYFGSVERISPEAPVPIVNIKKEESRLGGASNVANNISSLGGQTILCGAVGHDFFGKEIERMAKKKNIELSLTRTMQPTITKARIIGGKQQIVRLDYEEKIVLPEDEKENLKNNIIALLSECHVLVISDYGKGFITEEICQFLIAKAQEQHKIVVIDPKGKNWDKYSGADIITPNVKELSDIVGYPIQNDDREIEKAALEIIHSKHLSTLLVTRSEKGMTLVNATRCVHIPTHSEEVFDVSGAGDTVVATLSICLATGIDIVDAMKIANIAAGVVVKKIGTATLTLEELKENL